MDWGVMRISVDAWKEDGTNDYVPETMEDLDAFIPERPNDPADEEWLTNERGWVKRDGLNNWYQHTRLPLEFYNGEGAGDKTPQLACRLWRIDNPTRIQVALFEAALADGVKNE